VRRPVWSLRGEVPVRTTPGLILILWALAVGGCGSRDARAPTSPASSGSPQSTGVVIDEDLTSRQLFPTSNWWNLDVSAAPVDSNSAGYIDFISGRTPSNPGAVRHLHPDFGPPPYGIPLRLKASKGLSGYAPEIRKIFIAMQTYGLILADNGSDMYVTGTMDARWNNDVLNPAFGSLSADDFEVVQRGWNPGFAGVP
jgi:hypothetical protein